MSPITSPGWSRASAGSEQPIALTPRIFLWSQLALAFSAESVEVGPVMVKVETTSGVGAGVVVVMVGVGVVELEEELEEEEEEEEDEEVVVVLTEVAVLDGADSASWVGLLASWPWDLSDKVIEGTAVEAEVDEDDAVEVLIALLEEEVVLTVFVLDGVCVGLASSPWDLSDNSIEGRTFEVGDWNGAMKTLSGIPAPPFFVAKGTARGVADGLLVLDVVDVLEDSGSESWVGLLVTTVVEVVVGSIETLTRLPSLAVVTTTGVMVIPGPELEEVLTTEVGSSRVFRVGSAPSGPTIWVDVAGGWDVMGLPEASTMRMVVLLIVGPGGVTTTTFVVGVWVLDVLVLSPTLFMRSAILEASMLVELLVVEVEVVDDEVLGVIVVLKVVVSTTEPCGAM